MSTATSSRIVAIVGSGPAGLMAATVLAKENPHVAIHLFEKRPALGRKLLIAGSSGLNISHELSLTDFVAHYEGFDPDHWSSLLQFYGAKEWIEFIEKELGLETFLGTSKRFFVREMKASGLLKRWNEYLKDRGVSIHTHCELIDFKNENQKVELRFSGPHASEFKTFHASQAVFALGGASWETEIPAWYFLFQQKQILTLPFSASNVGYEVAWSKKFLAEAEGKPLKKVCLKTERGEKLGELVITEYGLEGTPIYFCGVEGAATLDLKPDLSEAEILEKLLKVKENFSPMRRVKHYLALSEAAESLLFHYTDAKEKSNLETLVKRIKNFPLTLLKPRPLSESISSRGGVALTEIDENFSLKRFPQIYCAGEMLAWDAPTGGFLIQAAVSQGAKVGQTVARNFT